MAERAKDRDSKKNLNQIKIKMAQLEWYKKFCKNKEIGYYDCYKNQLCRSDMDVTKLKKFLTNYWRNLVEWLGHFYVTRRLGFMLEEIIEEWSNR